MGCLNAITTSRDTLSTSNQDGEPADEKEAMVRAASRAENKHLVPRRRARWIYAFMLVIHFMLALDTTSVAVALPVR